MPGEKLSERGKNVVNTTSPQRLHLALAGSILKDYIIYDII